MEEGYPFKPTRCMNKDQAKKSKLGKKSKWERKTPQGPRKLKK